MVSGQKNPLVSHIQILPEFLGEHVGPQASKKPVRYVGKFWTEALIGNKEAEGSGGYGARIETPEPRAAKSPEPGLGLSPVLQVDSRLETGSEGSSTCSSGSLQLSWPVLWLRGQRGLFRCSSW